MSRGVAQIELGPSIYIMHLSRNFNFACRQTQIVLANIYTVISLVKFLVL
jgi:hypothetical protein